MNDRLIDILTAKAKTLKGDLYITLNLTTHNWEIGVVGYSDDVRSGLIDRSNLKVSIATAVNQMSKQIPVPELY